MPQEVFIPDDIEKIIKDNIISFRDKYSSNYYIDEIDNTINDWKTTNQLSTFMKFYPTNYKDIKYLEIGVGQGFNLINSLKDGYDIVGIEPGNSVGFTGRYQLALDLMKANNIQDPTNKLFQAVAEDLPFEDKTFDFIFSIAVLEHVNDIQEVFTQADRVLKDGGIMYMNIPNYNSFFEGHYGMFWLPYIFMSKKIAKLYVKLRGKDASYVDELIFTTPKNIEKIAKKTLSSNSFKSYPHISGFLSVFGLIYFAIHTNTMQDNKVVKYINSSKITLIFAKLISSIVVKLYIKLGFAKTFNFIYFKNKKSD